MCVWVLILNEYWVNHVINKCAIYYRAQSKRKIMKMDFEKCRLKFNKCGRIECNRNEDFVCGSDATTYSNICNLQIASCL